jgi:2OG-Fe(II) oxygenase superfamily
MTQQQTSFHSIVFRRLILLLLTTGQAQHTPRIIHFVNNAEHVEVYWIHPTTHVGHLHKRLAPHDIARISSYEGHEFELRDASCFVGTCRRAILNVSTPSDDIMMVATLQQDWTIMVTSDTPSQGIQRCRQDATDDITALLDCIRPMLEYKFQRDHDYIRALEEARQRTAFYLENYTCADEALGTTPPLQTIHWEDRNSNSSSNTLYNVDIHHNRSTAQIHVIPDFVSSQECSHLMSAAASRYNIATAAGSSHYSRRAQDAAVETPWDQPDHPLTQLSQRIYDYANHVLGLHLHHAGQDMLTAIRYTPTLDRYMPHCDAKGVCSSEEKTHVHGERVATMILYCQVPKRGGATNFQQLDIKVAPKLHQAIFFSYLQPTTLRMDAGMTQHSGCPVLEGEKVIVTQWLRLGVSQEWDFTKVTSKDVL